MSKRLLLLCVALSLSTACAEKAPAHGCRADAQCPSGSRCTTGVCSGDTRPTAAIADPGSVEEYALVRIDGSGSFDPDADVSQYQWSIRAVDAPCAAPEVTDIGPVAQVRFGCAGSYEVTLVVHDVVGGASDPARKQLAVAASTATPIVSAGPDVAVDHVCSGSPLRCRTVVPVALQATAAAGASLRWIVLPPAERPLDAHRRVTFGPSASDPAPTVQLETDGTAISGDWVFRVEAYDAYGPLGAAHTRVSVRNRAPVVTFASTGPFPHGFDPERREFIASGAVKWSVQDPDGDPVDEITGTWAHSGDGEGSVFDGDFGTGLESDTVTFHVRVPYRAPADALWLRGGPRLVREIDLQAIDVNRMVGAATFPIEIGNRPPVPAGGTIVQSWPHHFDPARSMYVALVPVGRFVDPDGDPIVDSVAPGLCGILHADDGGNLTAECVVPFNGMPAVDQLVGVRAFPVIARDPWDATPDAPVRTVEIQNSTPVLTTSSPSTPPVMVFPNPINCGYRLWHFLIDRVEFDVEAEFQDPDGDPVLVLPRMASDGRVTPAGTVLAAPGKIPFHYSHPGGPCVFLPESLFSSVRVSDGAAHVEHDVTPALENALR